MTTAADIRREQAARRRARLAELIRLHFDDKQVDFITLTKINQGELSGLLKDKSFGGVKARGLEKAARVIEGSLDMPEGTPFYQAGANHTFGFSEGDKSQTKSGIIGDLNPQSFAMMDPDTKQKLKKVTPLGEGWRRIPKLSYMQARMMTPDIDPSSLGTDLPVVITRAECSEHAFALDLADDSMHPRFEEGDTFVVDPGLAPKPGWFVFAVTGEQEVVFRKYRPRSKNERGETIFELVPLNDDYPTLNSEYDRLHILGVAVQRHENLLNP